MASPRQSRGVSLAAAGRRSSAHLITERVPDDVHSMIVEAADLETPTAYDVVFKECEAEHKKQKSKWHGYCSRTKYFGDADPDGYFLRLNAQIELFELQERFAMRRKQDAANRARVVVRRQKMLRHDRDLKAKNLEKEMAVREGDDRFHVSPSKAFNEYLRRSRHPSVSGPAGSAGFPTEFVTFQQPSRPSSVESAHSSEFAGRERHRSSTNTPPYMSLDFELNASEYDRDEHPPSLQCTQTPRSVNPEKYTTAIMRSQRAKHASEGPTSFSVASSENIQPMSVGERLKRYRVPHSTKPFTSASLSARWKAEREALPAAETPRSRPTSARVPRPPKSPRRR